MIKQSAISVISFAKEQMEYIFNPNQKFHKWGVDNLLPFEYLKLYQTVPEHASSIEFITDLVIGEGLSIDKLDYWVTKKLIEDYNIFGGFALQVIKTRGGDSVLGYVDISKCRYSQDKKQIGYAEEGWDKYKQEFKYYPITNSIKNEGIFLYKNNSSRSLYPTPSYLAAATSLSTMSHISEYHNNNAENGFAPSVVINMNNGIPDDETQEKIEKGIKEKFTGSKGKKFILSFNESEETKTTIEHLQTDNLDEKFETLQKFIQNQIIISHRITSGTLIGIVPENQGFNKTEYQEALDIFKEITINGIRKELEYAFCKLIGGEVKFIDKQIITIPTVSNDGGQV